MTIDQILSTRPYVKWHDSPDFQLSNYSRLEHLLRSAYKTYIYVPKDWVEPLQGFVIVAGLSVFIEQGNQRFAYRVI